MTERERFDMTEYKTCSKCLQKYPANSEFFTKNTRSPDGLRPDCKLCSQKRARDYYKNNATRIQNYQKQYIALNRAKISAREQKKYQRNKDHILAYVKNRYLQNPEVMKISSRNRRARKAKVISEAYTWQEIIQIHGSNCWLCGLPVDLEANRKVGDDGWEVGLHLDHVIPLLINGPDLKWNVQPTHGLCNLMRRRRL